jgi:hypothetical protein
MAASIAIFVSIQLAKHSKMSSFSSEVIDWEESFFMELAKIKPETARMTSKVEIYQSLLHDLKIAQETKNVNLT